MRVDVANVGAGQLVLADVTHGSMDQVLCVVLGLSWLLLANMERHIHDCVKIARSCCWLGTVKFNFVFQEKRFNQASLTIEQLQLYNYQLPQYQYGILSILCKTDLDTKQRWKIIQNYENIYLEFYSFFDIFCDFHIYTNFTKNTPTPTRCPYDTFTSVKLRIFKYLE